MEIERGAVDLRLLAERRHRDVLVLSSVQNPHEGLLDASAGLMKLAVELVHVFVCDSVVHISSPESAGTNHSVISICRSGTVWNRRCKPLLADSESKVYISVQFIVPCFSIFYHLVVKMQHFDLADFCSMVSNHMSYQNFPQILSGNAQNICFPSGADNPRGKLLLRAVEDPKTQKRCRVRSGFAYLMQKPGKCPLAAPSSCPDGNSSTLEICALFLNFR